MGEVLMLPANRIFRLRVCSDDLAGALIQKGDSISCERTDNLERGQFGAVQTPYGILLRYFFLEPEGYVRLEPIGPDLATLCLSPHEVRILGRPLSLQRDLRGMNKSGGSDSDA
jgi:SOS-response transcriptional repressor LexA